MQNNFSPVSATNWSFRRFNSKWIIFIFFCFLPFSRFASYLSQFGEVFFIIFAFYFCLFNLAHFLFLWLYSLIFCLFHISPHNFRSLLGRLSCSTASHISPAFLLIAHSTFYPPRSEKLLIIFPPPSRGITQARLVFVCSKRFFIAFLINFLLSTEQFLG